MSSTKVKVVVDEDGVRVSSPFNNSFVKAANELGGKWRNDVWNFDLRDEERVRHLCMDIYGTDGSPTPLATIRVNLDAAMQHNRSDDELIVGPVTVLKKFNRDSAPRLGTGCVVISGGLKSYGGSRNNPKITCEPGTIIEVRDIPLTIASRLTVDYSDAYSLMIEESDPDELTPGEASLVAILAQLPAERLAIVLAAVKN